MASDWALRFARHRRTSSVRKRTAL